MTARHSRSSLTSNIENLFKSKPGAWISMRELAQIGGVGGWRSRICDVRKSRGLDIEWNKRNGSKSAYRFVNQLAIDLTGKGLKD